MYVCKYAESAAPPLSLEHRRVIILRAINQFRFLYFILIVRLSYVLLLLLLLLLRCRRHHGRQLFKKRTFKYVYYNVIIKYIMKAKGIS